MLNKLRLLILGNLGNNFKWSLCYTNMGFYHYSDSPMYATRYRPIPITNLIFSSWELRSESTQWKLFCGFSLGNDVHLGPTVACHSNPTL